MGIWEIAAVSAITIIAMILIVLTIIIVSAWSTPVDFQLGTYDNVQTSLSPGDWQKMLRAYLHHVENESGRTYLLPDSRDAAFMRDLTDKQFYALKDICRRGF
jgi:hypothetical protein